MINSKNYITVQGWMSTDLKLNGNELLCYALIYGFSQDGSSVFAGPAGYIAEWLNIDRRQVMRILQKLTEKGLIEKIDKTVNGVKLVDYRITPQKGVLDVIGCDKMSYPCDNMSHHIDIDNNKEKKNNSIINNTITKRKENDPVLDEKERRVKALVKLLSVHIEDVKHSVPNTNGWDAHIRGLLYRDGNDPDEVFDVMEWHFKNLDRPYCHVILSAKAFREKYDMVKAMMKKNEGAV